MSNGNSILPTTHTNGQPGIREIGRGPSYIEQQREARRKRGPLSWHLKKPAQSSTALAWKNHFVAAVGEFVGTTLFMIFALGGTNVANTPTTSVTGDTTAGEEGSVAAAVNTSSLLYIALSFGFSLTVNAWIFFRVSGGLFNPSVSLGMALVGAITWLRAAILIVAQLLGGIVGSAIIDALIPGPLNVRTSLASGVSVARGLFIEMFLTAMLMLTILLLAAEKSKATFLAPIGIGLALFIAELMGVYYTGGSLNPARSLGPAVILRSFNSYHWIYWLGPALGATIAAGLYKFLKWMEYETVLGPDVDDEKPMLPATKAGTVGATEGGTAPVMGPGLADLLTEGSPEAVYSLNPNNYEQRLEKIEGLLHQIIESQSHGVGSKTYGNTRDSMATFVGDHSHRVKGSLDENHRMMEV